MDTLDGIISRAYPGQMLYDVRTDVGLPYQCVYGTAFFSALLGVKMGGRLAVGTRVKIIPGNPGTITSCIGADMADLQSAQAFRATAGSDVSVEDRDEGEATQSFQTHRLPHDMLEGEFQIQNALGVGIQWLTHLIKLGASDGAKIEAFIFDDLIRVISGAYHHMSAFGDFRITRDQGKLDCRWSGTSWDHEAWGLEQERDVKVETQDGVLAQTTAEEARLRFSQFVGYLGDFVHTFVTDPGAGLGQLAQERAGKFHLHVNTDGTLLVQSVADIVFERVHRVLVPVELKRQGDNTGNGKNNPPNQNFLKTWSFDPTKPWQAAYQLRDYARWLSQYHAYARYLQSDLDWNVPSETDAPTPSYGNGEPDRERRIPERDRQVMSVYSCWRMMRDGSIVVTDGYGSSWMMTGGSVTVSTPLDYRIEAGRDIIMVAGRNCFLKAHRHVEIVAVIGSLMLKARARLTCLCERGTILIKTLMRGGPPATEDPVLHRFGDPLVGIAISAPHASVLHSAGKQLTVEGGFEDPTTYPVGVDIVSGKSDIRMRAPDDKAVQIKAGSLRVKVLTWVASAVQGVQIRTPYLNLADRLFKADGKLYSRTLHATALKVGSVLSAARLTGKAPPDATKSAPPHTNHVGFLEDRDELEVPAVAPEELAQQMALSSATPAAPVKAGAELARTIADFLPGSEYPAQDLQQSLAQQMMEQSMPHPTGATFTAWDYILDGAQGDVDAVHKLPYPGPQAQQQPYVSLNDPSQMSDLAPGQHVPNPNPIAATRSPSFQRWTAEGVKVMP